jgi:hypothetical protein
MLHLSGSSHACVAVVGIRTNLLSSTIESWEETT